MADEIKEGTTPANQLDLLLSLALGLPVAYDSSLRCTPDLGVAL